ncbi:hypothetical protein V6667_01070 [Neisseria leonii]|uniref:Uncharacterized protein n=1 Tax=Neisseria leonii TaxID=2995413 RepID=A0A9X4IEZ3_9NEIS|nr:hypothetical protein [Neisseria sp. 51.81]MDD9328633.1 hypothetical protein [Neisseria sp. 51.81]
MNIASRRIACAFTVTNRILCHSHHATAFFVEDDFVALLVHDASLE